MSAKNTGFALIEVIISIVVLSGVLAGASSLVWSAATAVERNQDRLTATYLAQECLELARNVRDSAWRQHLQWDCAFESSPTIACKNLAKPISQLMNKESLVKILGEQTKFSRQMKIERLALNKELSIQCEVSWPRRSGTDRVFLHEILTDWRKK